MCLVIVIAAASLIDRQSAPKSFAALDLEKDEVVAHVAQPAKLGGTRRHLQGTMYRVFHGEHDRYSGAGKPLYQRIKEIMDALGVSGGHREIPHCIDHHPSYPVRLYQPED